jgi:exopolysaccharide biosynthesis polyprenyl glycosylphosphotransferase
MHKRNWNATVGLLFADLALIVLSLALAFLGRAHLPFGVPLTAGEVLLPLPVFLLGAVAWLVNAAVLGVYNPRLPRTRLAGLHHVLGAILLSNLALAGLLYLSFRDVPRLLFVYAVILQVLFLIGLRVVLRFWRSARRGPMDGTRVVIVGAGRAGLELAQRIRAEGSDLTLLGFLDDDPALAGREVEGVPVLGVTTDTARIAGELEADEVLLALPLRAHQHTERLVRELQEAPVRVRVVPDFFDLAFFRATIEDFRGVPLIGLRDPAIDGQNRVVKRAFDLTLASTLLVLTLPVMAVVALAVRLDSPGPALFRQQRVGENGRLFTIYKFRSMLHGSGRAAAANASSAGGSSELKRRDDPRVTAVGRFIRRSSLDELPQLFNVLKGDMSMVGPRPELPWLVERYESWQMQRFTVPPGITGWWQVNGRSDRPMHLHTEDDLYYVQHYSPLLDLQILWRTIGAVVRGKGAY